MKTLRTAIAVAMLLTALLSLGVLTATAQGPTGSSTTQIAYLDNQSHTIPANSSQLFRFDYAVKDDGTRPVTTIRLVNGTNSGVNFQVWTPDQLRAQANTVADAAADKFDNQPLGRGSAANVNCDSGVLNGTAACQSPDLVWSGAFGTSGPYFVRVINNNNSDSKYQLLIQGSGVSLTPQTQVASAAPSQGPAAAPPLAAASGDPTKATAIDGQSHTLAGGAATWHHFDYAVKDDGTRPLVTIRLVNGTKSGVNFEVWTADQLRAQATTAADATADKFDNQPLGRGSAENVDCDSGVLNGTAACQSPDLVWKGAFGTSGTYFVKVINTTNSDGNYQLVMTTQ